MRSVASSCHSASALDHPNIVTIYDVVGNRGHHFIAMQYVAGKTLRALLASGRLECSRLRYQIADALAQAHARRIVHRDLKPENLMVTEQDQVKILDFGLALLTAADEPGDAASGENPTLSVRWPKLRTEDGTVLGTVAYMSPEQAEGKRVDARSDIFSLGRCSMRWSPAAVRFKATRRPPPWPPSCEEPKPVRELAEGVPAELERVIARCLRKDRAKRFQHMDDLKVALEEIKEESESGRLTASPSRQTSATHLARAGDRGGGAGSRSAGGGPPRPHPAKPTSGPVIARLTSDPGLTTEPALSGRQACRLCL